MLHVGDLGQQDLTELPLPLVGMDRTRQRRIGASTADDRPEIGPAELFGAELSQSQPAVDQIEFDRIPMLLDDIAEGQDSPRVT